jgi:hypothetical protein
MYEPSLIIEPVFFINGKQIPLKQTIVPVIFMVDMCIEIEEKHSNISKDFQGQMCMSQIINLN